MYSKVSSCRICGNQELVQVLDLGEQVLTGVFPAAIGQKITKGPLSLVKCMGEAACGLLQLEHSYELSEMYGDNYGYRSGLNASMVEHLNAKVARIRSLVGLSAGDLVIDIGSNDSTTLRAYPKEGLLLVGVDPTGTKFKEYYPDHVALIPDFFSAPLVKARYPGKKAKVITSFSMFYDLESPMQFMREIHELLDDQGIWVFEQSYMPLMLATNAYDTVCHEHLEYYALKQIKWMADRVGFTIVDIEFNNINGGSFSVTVGKAGGKHRESGEVAKILQKEQSEGLDTLAPYQQFAERVQKLKSELRAFVEQAKKEKKRVVGLGASTKGNVVLQYCGFTKNDIDCVGEVNKEKYGRFTPGSEIPIVSEEALAASKPDYLIVLPWHFRPFFVSSKRLKGLNLVFPMPNIEVVKVG